MANKKKKPAGWIPEWMLCTVCGKPLHFGERPMEFVCKSKDHEDVEKHMENFMESRNPILYYFYSKAKERVGSRKEPDYEI
jgi:hypothetical protein